ncbi:MAG: hypothetical protein N3G74_00875 [Candidatus Micrarchaeota archaeon]|nr:hypothetical protein [Candidatus Micrarchaeota archaeon]
MQNVLNKKDVLNLVAILLYSYFLLNLISNPSLNTYERSSQLGLDKIKMNEISSLSVFAGIAFVLAVYLISRIVFRQTEIAVLVSGMLMVSSYAFVNNFMFGISDFTNLIFGQFTESLFGLEKFGQILPLLPLSLLSIYVMYLNKKAKYMFTGIIALIASFFIPLVSLPFLFILSADGFDKIRKIKDRSLLSTITGGAVAATIASIILGQGMTAIALSILVGLVIAIVILAFENKHTLIYLLILTLIMVSIEYAIAHNLNVKRIDTDTMQAISWIKELEGRIGFASIYEDELSNVAHVEAGKRVLTDEAFVFIFTNKTANLDYLIIDTLILDAPKEYARSINATATFDTFAFAGIQRQGETYYQIYLTYKNDHLIIPTDSAGNLISNKVIINGAEDSYFKLILLNASDPSYRRYIHPRSDVDKNVFKILYPDQFGKLSGYDIKEIKSSNNSRFRLYSIVKQ